ncbi:hypothetical protein BDR03DRAFT_962335 [Suillus americanus]|nr:hypothetical protein BDR03DRAFT_962335 [Suillus americanus]
MQSINLESKVNLSTISDIITALQTILCSQAIPGIPDFETPYSRTKFSNLNHCAIELEGQSINAIIAERQHQLDKVLHDFSGLQIVIRGIITIRDQLLNQKKKIIESLNLHRRLVSPLWRLPTEVLSQIFCHFLPQVPKLGKLQPPSKLTVPMSLTRICRRWREVVVDMPDLWCVLSVRVDDSNWQQAAFCYDSWLKRAQGRPLSLRLQFHADDHSTKLQHLLQPYTNQIKSLLSCDYYDDETLDVCDLLDAFSLPALRVLTIRGAQEWPHEQFKAFLVRSQCPLESLIVRGSVVTDEQRAEYVALVPSLQSVIYPACSVTEIAI